HHRAAAARQLTLARYNGRNEAMAMSMGKPGKEPEVMIDINTTPLIDVMLVQLVMLIITIPIQLHSVNHNMPVRHPPPPLNRHDARRLESNPPWITHGSKEIPRGTPSASCSSSRCTPSSSTP